MLVLITDRYTLAREHPWEATIDHNENALFSGMFLFRVRGIILAARDPTRFFP